MTKARYFESKTLILFVVLFVATTMHLFASDDWETWYEKHDKNETPTYDETIRYARKLADQSPYIHYSIIGKSHRNKDIPLLILDMNGNFSPEAVHNSGNKILLVNAAIHPGEPVGKDAGLMLFRDIAIKNMHHQIMDDITLLFIPIMNVDGHERFGPYNRINQDGPREMGWRTNALNLNLNRDFLKTDSDEVSALLDLWQQWDPDFFIDTHSTNGGDYQYAMTYATGTNKENMYKDLAAWVQDTYLSQVEEKMEDDGFPVFPYVTYRSWHDPRSGLRSGVGNPMYSTSYANYRNRPGLLLETHMLKPYKIRVESTYRMLVNTIDVLHHDQSLQRIVDTADKFTASNDFLNKDFPLSFEMINDSIMVDFLGVEYKKVKSDLTGGDWFIYDSDKPAKYQIAWFNQHKPNLTVKLPEFYIVPVEYEDVIERLKIHGIEMIELADDKNIQVESYKFSNVSLSGFSREGRQTASFQTESISETRTYPKGSVIIPMNQSGARLVAMALEPEAYGSYAYWGFFNAIFERVEYFESYTMEQMAREMIKEDPSLKEKLNKEMEENPDMAENPYAILTWFYQQTPYYDQQHNIYPVGRIMNADDLYPGLSFDK
ncbi:MAG: M14 family metallopeptidase [Bacteroidales bacterium]